MGGGEERKRVEGGGRGVGRGGRRVFWEILVFLYAVLFFSFLIILVGGWFYFFFRFVEIEI